MKIGGVASPGGALCRSHSKREISARSNTATSPSSTSVGAAMARMAATMAGKRRVRSTPCRLTSFTAAPSL